MPYAPEHDEIPNPLRPGLRADSAPEPCAVVIFGASGDLAHRKLVPALYNLAVGALASLCHQREQNGVEPGKGGDVVALLHGHLIKSWRTVRYVYRLKCSTRGEKVSMSSLIGPPG